MNTAGEQVRVRPATLDDVDDLADIYLSSARHHVALDAALYRVPDRDAVATHLREALVAQDEATSVRLVAEDGGVVVGSADVDLRSPGAASMMRPERGASIGIAVLEGSRGAGIGSRLMEAAEAWAREHGATVFMLDASAANTEALRFYQQRHGYRLAGVLLTKAVASDR